jgi:hypothetical protein
MNLGSIPAPGGKGERKEIQVSDGMDLENITLSK